MTPPRAHFGSAPNAGHGLGVHIVRMRPTIDVRPATEDFGDFFRREYARLARARLLLTGSPTEAEELAQESLVRVYARWNDVGSMESPEGYLYRTALNLNRKRIRRLAVRARHLRQAWWYADEIEVAEERLDVLRAVATLPRGQREALVLVEWLDLDINEVGSSSASLRHRCGGACIAPGGRSANDQPGARLPRAPRRRGLAERGNPATPRGLCRSGRDQTRRIRWSASAYLRRVSPRGSRTPSS
jgi:DNA-directed RNA polymerase specialized sigma24 family protein